MPVSALFTPQKSVSKMFRIVSESIEPAHTHTSATLFNKKVQKNVVPWLCHANNFTMLANNFDNINLPSLKRYNLFIRSPYLTFFSFLFCFTLCHFVQDLSMHILIVPQIKCFHNRILLQCVDVCA